MYLLDTNICIKILNGRSDASTQNILQYLRAYETKDISLCSVVKYELWYGAYKSQRVAHNLKLYREFMKVYYSFDFDNSASVKCGEIRANLEINGTPIGSYDTMIAAIAMVNNLILVTNNTAEFQRVPGLVLENWAE